MPFPRCCEDLIFAAPGINSEPRIMIKQPEKSPIQTSGVARRFAMLNRVSRTKSKATSIATTMATTMAITMATILAIAVLAFPAPTQARSSVGSQTAPGQLAQQADIGASAAAAAASAASGGRVLNVKRRSSPRGITYRVKLLLPGGRMRTLTVDGQTGQVR